MVEVNIGMNRCGIRIGEPVVNFIKKINKLQGLKFLGIFAYEGHAVFIESLEERYKETNIALEKVSHTKELLEKESIFFVK